MKRTDPSPVESLHLTGPLPAVRRLAQLASKLKIDHEVSSGVLRVAVEDSPALFDRASTALAPLEACLVRVVRTDLASGSPESLLAAAGAAPTLAHLIGRRKHRLMLETIRNRSGVTFGFQPVVELGTAKTIGFEALLRVRVGSHDAPPGEVLAAAEDAGRLSEVDASARSVAVHEAAPSLGDRLLYLNVLPSSLPFPREQLTPFKNEVIALGLDPGHIVLEAPVGPAGSLRRQLEAVFEAARASGFLVGLDNVRSERDLNAITFRPDVVKLDRSVVRGLSSASGMRSLGSVVRETGHASSTLIAQGIESVDQKEMMRDLGVRYGQGWHLGRPGVIATEVLTASQ